MCTTLNQHLYILSWHLIFLGMIQSLWHIVTLQDFTILPCEILVCTAFSAHSIDVRLDLDLDCGWSILKPWSWFSEPMSLLICWCAFTCHVERSKSFSRSCNGFVPKYESLWALFFGWLYFSFCTKPLRSYCPLISLTFYSGQILYCVILSQCILFCFSFD